MTILVTGASGFLGQHIVEELLNRGERVIAYDLLPFQISDNTPRSQLTLITDDLMEITNWQKVFQVENVDTIIHLVALKSTACQKNPFEGYRINVLGSIHVFDLALSLDITKVIFPSSIAIYGSLQERRFVEEDPTTPQTIYGMTKMAVEHLGRHYSSTYHLSMIALRLERVYGPGRRDGEFEELVERLLSGADIKEPITLSVPGNVHVRDATQAFLAALQIGTFGYKVFNIANSKQLSTQDASTLWNSIVPPNIENVRSELSASIRFVAGHGPRIDSSKANLELGWVARIKPSTGWSDYIAWLRDEKANTAQ